MAWIEARNLSKRYGTTLAVNDLSFDLEPGRVTGFLGPNGAGKSTTMRLMLGLDHGSGQTLFDGVPYTQLPHPMRLVGTVLEGRAFHPTRTARNHLRMLASANGIPTRRVDEVLEYVGLSSVAKKKPKTFSLGMGQRLGLAAALLGDPSVLILDEPANGLDPQGITWLRNFLKNYAESGRTVFVSSHLLAEMALMADHLVVIGQGRLLASGPVEQFTHSSSQTRVTVRTPEPQRLADALHREGAQVEPQSDGALHVVGREQADVGELAFHAGVVVHELTTRVATLEEAFLEATAHAEDFIAHDGQAAALPPEVLGAPGPGGSGGPGGAQGQPPGPQPGPPPPPGTAPPPPGAPSSGAPPGPPPGAPPPGAPPPGAPPPGAPPPGPPPAPPPAPGAPGTPPQSPDTPDQGGPR